MKAGRDGVVCTVGIIRYLSRCGLTALHVPLSFAAGGSSPAHDARLCAMKHLVILGATGSIGRQAIEVLSCVPDVRLVGLAARSNAALVLEQAAAAGARLVALHEPGAADEAAARADVGLAGAAGDALRVYAGDDGVAELVHEAGGRRPRRGASLTVLNAIVGAAGLRATLVALECGATLALANKESMVAGGPFVVDAARATARAIVPVDSEHSALFQCLGAGGRRGARSSCRSRGRAAPFRTAWPDERARAGVTPEQALAHPNWTMGPKITDRLGHAHEQGPRGDRGALPVRRALRTRHRAAQPAEHRPQHGALRRRGDPRPPRRARHAYADRLRPRLPRGASRRCRWSRRLDLLAARPQLRPSPTLERFPCLRMALEAGKRAAHRRRRRAARAGSASRRRVAASPRAPPPLAPRTVAAPIVLNAANEVAVHAFLERAHRLHRLSPPSSGVPSTGSATEPVESIAAFARRRGAQVRPRGGGRARESVRGFAREAAGQPLDVSPRPQPALTATTGFREQVGPETPCRRSSRSPRSPTTDRGLNIWSLRLRRRHRRHPRAGCSGRWLIGILGLAFLVTIHEFGHFIAAKSLRHAGREVLRRLPAGRLEEDHAARPSTASASSRWAASARSAA